VCAALGAHKDEWVAQLRSGKKATALGISVCWTAAGRKTTSTSIARRAMQIDLLKDHKMTQARSTVPNLECVAHL
jgi:hypothetical protein